MSLLKIKLIVFIFFRSFASVKADLIPYLLECQYNENKQSLDEILELNDSFKCFAYRLTTKDCSFLAQCNTISSYFEASKTVFFFFFLILSKIKFYFRFNAFWKKFVIQTN